MARAFTSTDVLDQGTAALPLTTGTLALWFMPTWAQTDSVDHMLFVVQSGGNYWIIEKYSDNALYGGWYGAAATGTYTLTEDAWNHLAVTWTSAPLITLYVNGASVATSATGGFDSAGITRALGARANGTTSSEGSVAEYGVWAAALDAAEVAALAKGASPALVRPAALEDYLLLAGRASPEPNVWGGTAGTLTGTAYADHPRIYRPAGPLALGVPTAAPAAGQPTAKRWGGIPFASRALLYGGGGVGVW